MALFMALFLIAVWMGAALMYAIQIFKIYREEKKESEEKTQGYS